MANPSSYVGQYGDTLRRLSALDAQAGAFAAPQQIGGADQGAQGGGAFQPTVAPQSTRAMIDQPGAFATPMQGDPAAAPQGAIAASQAPAQAPAPQAPATVPGIAGPQEIPSDDPGAGPKGKSWRDLSKEMPEEVQDQLADTIEERKGQPIDEAFDEAVQTAGPPDHLPAKPSRREKALYVAEIALRTMSNMATGRYENSQGAFADAMLTTEGRRGALTQAEVDRQRAETEKRRLEARSDKKDKAERQDKIDEREDKQKFDSSEKDLDRKSEEYKERLKAKAELLKDKGQRTKLTVNDRGEYVLLDDTGKAIVVTEDVTETSKPTKGSRGNGNNSKTTTTKKPVKALPKPSGSDLDADTVQRQISLAVKDLKEDRDFMRGLKAKGLKGEELSSAVETEARKRVKARVSDEVATPDDEKITDINDL